METHFTRADIDILRKAETAHLVGTPAVTGAVLKDGRTVDCEMFLAATGIRPNIRLARDAGVPVNKGVLVDDRVATGEVRPAPQLGRAGCTTPTCARFRENMTVPDED